MARLDEATKEQRKERLRVTLQRQRGLTEGELAGMLQLERRTVNNYLRELEMEGKVYKEGTLWLAFNYQETRLRSFDLTPEEAMTLYLGARLLVKQHDRRNEPAESALLKLADVLKSDAGIGDEIYQAAREMAHRPVEEGYQPIFRTLMRGYVYRKRVEMVYQPLHGNPFHTYFATYLVEPSTVGYTTYLIGHSSTPNALRAYKLERVQSARLTDEDYRIPEDFPGLDILRHAWSIVMGDEQVEVTLRFNPRARQRVLETRWHPSQETWDDPDRPGYLLWKVQVADTLDMLPWIRGWGSDVEVLEPGELRQTLTREAQRIAGLYQIVDAAEPEAMNYAHSREGLDKSKWQPLRDHLFKTAERAEKLGQDAGIASLARTAALLHDIGKYSRAFQRRLEGARRSVDHATAGAKEIVSLFPEEPHKTFAGLLSYCIAGHHSGLPDYGDPSDMEGDPTLLARREKKQLEDYSAYKMEIDPVLLTFEPRHLQSVEHHRWFSISFLTRMIFSTLVDADWLDTETYMEAGAKPRGEHATIEELCRRFNQHMQRYGNPQGAVNQKRTETLKACNVKAAEKPGFFTLTVPTGGGKTLASMAFALNHAVAHGLKRVIYVIPFTSIIEQNAAVFKECLGEENVLEHHSNFDWQQEKDTPAGDDETNSVLSKLKLAAENWDIPIVVTTNVQFFESLFANKKSRARKLHNMAKSVIVFDEAQMLPREYLQPCMLAVRELVQNYGASAVFCTATQPDLKQFLPGVPMIELAPDPQALFDFYRRVQVKIAGRLPDQELAQILNAHDQVLCIVNTRRHAKGLFDLLEGDGRFHLSTLMCPAHRKETLQAIRQRLQDREICRVISTQVMEAGVDLDFPVGYRALAGLDSIVQAAGRVNRERRNPSGDVYVFEPETAFIRRTPAFIQQTAGAATSILREHGDDPVSVQAIQAYFKLLDTLQDPRRSYDAKHVLACLDKSTGFDFKTAAEKFKLIDDGATASVIVPYNQATRDLLEKVRYSPFPASFVRQLQIYTVNLYQREFEALQAKGAIETYQDIYSVLNNMQYYDPRTGIILPAEDGGVAIFFD